MDLVREMTALLRLEMLNLTMLLKCPVLLLKYFVPIKGEFFYFNNMTRLIRTPRAC